MSELILCGYTWLNVGINLDNVIPTFHGIGWNNYPIYTLLPMVFVE